MSQSDLRKLLITLQLSRPQAAARILGLAPRLVRRFVAGERDIPSVTLERLRLLDERGRSIRHSVKE